jgi:hypothetical protein
MSYDKKNKIPKEKGISVFFSVMILTVLLSVALGISTILVGQVRMIKGIGDSVIAFFTADTGVERIMYEDKKCRLPGCDTLSWPCVDTTGCDKGRYWTGTPVTGDFGPGTATYQVNFNNGATVISSKGTYRGTQRAINITR